MTIIAGFRCQDGIVVCSDTQETAESAKRNVPKLQCFHGPVVSQDGERMVNPDLALAICGAGDGPFIEKIASQAWDAIRHVSNVWEAAEQIETMIKDTYKDFGEIFQAGSCPSADLIYGISIGGQSRLFQATGPIVNERDYASSGIGYYLADFLAGRMRGTGWLSVRQSVILAAYILFQTKEHVEGCGGDSHIAVLREKESSGMVDWRLIEHLTEYLKLADAYTGEMLLASSDFTVYDDSVSENLLSLVDSLKFIRKREKGRLDDHRKEDFNLLSMIGPNREEDDLGLPVSPPSTTETSGTQQ